MKVALKANWWRMALATLLLMAIGIGVGLLFYISSGPDFGLVFYISSGPDFVAGALTQLLGRRVEIAELELHLGRSLEVELTGIQVFEGDGAEADHAPAFEAPRALGRQSWPRLLAGQFVPLEWTIEEPQLRLPMTGHGGRVPQPRLPLLNLRIENGRVEWQQSEGKPILIRSIQLFARRSGLRAGLDGSLTAELVRADEAIGQMALDFQGLTGDVAIKGRLQGLDLAALPMRGLPISSGRADGHVALRVTDNTIEGSLDIGVAGFQLDLPNLNRPIAPTEVHVRTDGRWKDGVLTLYPHPIRFDDLGISGALHIWPGRPGRVHGSLVLDPFRVGGPEERLQLIRLMGLRHAIWQRIDQRAEGGWLEDMEIKFDLPLTGLDQALAFRRKLRPEELSLVARIRDGVYRPRPDSKPLEEISGEMRVRGNLLEVHNLRMARGGKPLPELELHVDGMQRLVHLPPEERKTPPGPGVPIPGLGPAFTALAKRGETDQPPVQVQLSDFQIGYTAFVLPIRNLNARLSFPDGGVAVDEAEGVLGGAPARLSAVWKRETNHLSVDIAFQDGDAPPRSESNGSWAEGYFATETLPLGNWRVDGAAGGLRATGASVSLAEPGAAPFEFEIDVAGADAGTIRHYLGMVEGTVTGMAHGKGRLAGRLEPEHRFIEQAEVDLEARFEDGTLERLPAILALARLPSLQGVRALFGLALPYDSITAHFKIQQGMLRTENFLLQGPELRVLAAGEIDLYSPDLQADMTVALLFLQTIDWVIGQLPIVGDLILGKDSNLFALYFRLEGPWRTPTARLVTPEAIQTPTDWATKVIGGGMAQLKKLFSRDDSRSEGDRDEKSGATKNQ
jgi:hypothetical protein